jgi:glutaredoxin-like protein
MDDPDTMLDYIAPNAQKPKDVTIFTRTGCEFCTRAKGMLRDAGIHFEELVLNRDYSEATLRAVSGRSSVPQIFINGVFVGGSEELETDLQQEKAA